MRERRRLERRSGTGRTNRAVLVAHFDTGNDANEALEGDGIDAHRVSSALQGLARERSSADRKIAGRMRRRHASRY